MILKYLWAKLHRPFSYLVPFLAYMWFLGWLMDRYLYLGLAFGLLTVGIGALYLFRAEISEDYGKFKGAQ